ncbi:hypothetical protein GIB67_004731, partial [Kingdonia uniflora]
MVECWWATTHTFHLPCGELGISHRDFMVYTGIDIGTGEPMVLDASYTKYGNTITIFPNMVFKDYGKGCVIFFHIRTCVDHIRDPANTNTIFLACMLLYFGGILFGNSRSWARLKLLGPILLIEKKGPMIDFGSAILGHLYYYLDQASKQEVKYIGGLFQLMEYQCYEYCKIVHHILIDN